MSADELDLLSEDYSVVDHRLQLFLDMEVFEEEEELHSFLKVWKRKQDHRPVRREAAAVPGSGLREAAVWWSCRTRRCLYLLSPSLPVSFAFTDPSQVQNKTQRVSPF